MKLKKLSHYALKMYLQSQPSPKQIISFDIGTVHTGCATSCLNLKKPYVNLLNIKRKFLKSLKITHKFVSNDQSQYYAKLQTQILKIIKQTKPTALVFGIPQKQIQKQYYDYAKIGMRQLIDGFLKRCQSRQAQVRSRQGQLGSQSAQIGSRLGQIRQNLQTIHYTVVDQSWSTRQATSKLKEIQSTYAKWGHLHKQKQLIDGMAAMKIMERYLDYYNGK